MAKPAGFDRDIGYLMPFLDRVATTADTLPDATAREELKRLMAEEKERWARIQQLLGGALPAASPRPPASAPGLTVGSLKRQA